MPHELFQFYRQRSGLTQAQLGQILGLKSRRSIQAWETGEKLPSPQNLWKLLEAYLNLQLFSADDEVAEAQRLWFRIKDSHDARVGKLSQYPFFDQEKFAALVSTHQNLPLDQPDLRGQSSPKPPKHPDIFNSANQLPRFSNYLVGRERELDMLINLLKPGLPASSTARPPSSNSSSASLVTLFGGAGVGKTRLAVDVAHQMAGLFADGIYIVELAALNDPDLVVSAICEAVGVKEVRGQVLLETLKANLSKKQVLLILDNFEHLTKAGRFLEELGQGCRDLKMLVTSRALLKLYGEQVFELGPLELPDINGLNKRLRALKLTREALLTDIGQNAAVSLFVERVKLVRPEFVLTTGNMFTVAQICIKLEGLPLALELAAGRTRFYTLPELLTGLDNRLEILKDEFTDVATRQQTLENTLDWSYKLLNTDEQRIFRALSIFVDGFTPESLVEICQLDEATGTRYLNSLLDKSLITRKWPPTQFEARKPRSGGPVSTRRARFMMLETIREYAIKKLRQQSEFEQIHYNASLFYLNLAKEAEAGLQSEKSSDWLARMQIERPNLNTLLEWGAEGFGANPANRQSRANPDTSDGSGSTTTPMTSGDIRRLQISLELVGDWRSFWALQGSLKAERRPVELLVETARQYPELFRSRIYAKALSALVLVLFNQGQYEPLKVYAEEGRAIFQQMGDAVGMAYHITALGRVAELQSNYQLALQYQQEALSLYRGLNDKTGIAKSLDALAGIASHQNDYQNAQKLYQEALDLRRELKNQLYIAFSLSNLATIALCNKEFAQAHRLFEESLAKFEKLKFVDGIASCLHNLGCLYLFVDNSQLDYLKAKTLLRKSARIFEKAGSRLHLGIALNNLGLVAYKTDDFRRAYKLFIQSLQIHWELQTQVNIAYSLAGIVMVWQATDRLVEAAELAGILDELLRRLSAQLKTFHDYEYQICLTELKNKLAASIFQTNFAKGQNFAALETALKTFGLLSQSD